MTEKIISTINMNKRGLSKLTKSQLINLLLKQNVKQQPKNDNNIEPRRPIPTRSIQTVDLVIRLSVAMMINIVNP